MNINKRKYWLRSLANEELPPPNPNQINLPFDQKFLEKKEPAPQNIPEISKEDIDQEEEEKKECSNCRADLEGEAARGSYKNDGEIVCEECYIPPCDNCGSTDYESLMSENLSTSWSKKPNSGEMGCDECMAQCAKYRCPYTTYMNDMENAPHSSEYYCRDCFHELYTFCEECNETINNDESYYVNDRSLCEYCFTKDYDYCGECNKPYNKQNLREGASPDYDLFCENCAPELFTSKELPEAYKNLSKIESVGFSKNDRVLNELKRLLSTKTDQKIKVSELSRENPRLAQMCRDLIVFSKGKDITLNLIEEFRQNNQEEIYPVAYSTWRSDLQRTITSATPQLVINILASDKMLNEMASDKTSILFEKINEVSAGSGHPSAENQIGWARIELHPTDKYILVDEIQTDHMNAIDRIKNETYEGRSYQDRIRERLNLTQEELAEYLKKYKEHIKNFPDIAMEAISRFAKANGYDKIFYHTYESGKKLKRNAPPESLYTTLPIRHFFQPTEEIPFDLPKDQDLKFFSRKANKLLNKCYYFYKYSCLN